MSALPYSACDHDAPNRDALSGLCAACLLKAASSPSSLSELGPGSTLGPYQIMSPLGRGGMGQVHVAWDTRLCRTVAVKVLAAPFSTDTERTGRLEREARILAGLDHPRICAVYDVGHEGDLTYIVMEHLEGETLAEKLIRGPLRLHEAIKCAAEIAEGLDRAHRHDITHRDLKPANIMLTKEGAKLLDFGLAVRSYANPLAATPECTADYVSGLGGTMQYMAPEQLEGKTADVRSDVFSFGLVLHEMLTAQPAFSAKNTEELMAVVITAEPVAVSVLRPDVPPVLERIIKRCLQKDPDERWQSIRDVLFELKAAADGQTHDAQVARAASSSRKVAAPRMAALVASLTTMALALVSGPQNGPSSVDPEVLRFVVSPPQPPNAVGSPRGLATVSPDGRSLAWSVSNGQGRPQLAVQDLASAEVSHMEGTNGATFPFWSPDSRQIAFFANGKLKRIDITGGATEDIASAPAGQGGTWSEERGIVFAPDKVGPLYRVPRIGESAVPITTLDQDRNETVHQAPYFLPDGRRFIYFAASARAEERGIVLADADTRTVKRLASGDSGAVYAHPGYLLFARRNMLVAVPFDPTTGALAGDPVVVQKGIHFNRGLGMPYFSVSSNGILLFHTRQLPQSRLVWFNRHGQTVQTVTPPGTYRNPALSPDGRWVAAEQLDPEDGTVKIWMLDTARGTASLLTTTVSRSGNVVWSASGSELIFAANETSSSALYRAQVQAGSEQLVLQTSGTLQPTDWNEQVVLYGVTNAGNPSDIWALSVEEKREPAPWLHTRFNEREARFSPDGHWVAYTSDESGRYEVYLRPFRDSGPKWQISTEGGSQPCWRADGRELFYLSPARKLMNVKLVGAASTLRPAAPTILFELPRGEVVDSRNTYAVTPDGQRFLVNVEAENNPRLPMVATVVANWGSTLQRFGQ